MIARPILRQSTLLLMLGVGLQAPALDRALLESPPAPSASLQGQERSGDRQERRENRPERREVKQEHREVKQEHREVRQEHREVRQERREDHREVRQDRRQEHREVRQDLRPMDPARPLPRLAAPHGNPYVPPSRSREQVRAWEHNNGWRGEGAWGAHASWGEHRARAWETEHRDWAHRGGYGGYIIPEPRFRAYFGPERWFRIRSRPTIYMGYPRFRYGNYWFRIVDPWPEFWSETWYANDDVYIDYNNGYYLYNRRHPGIGIAISVSL